MGFSRQEQWSGLPWPPPDLPSSGMEPGSLVLQADSLLPELQEVQKELVWVFLT